MDPIDENTAMLIQRRFFDQTSMNIEYSQVVIKIGIKTIFLVLSDSCIHYLLNNDQIEKMTG